MFPEQQKSSPNFNLFPFHNPNLLQLCSIDIPQPIIHPSGADPCSLLNPNLHGNDRLEPLPALDVDPYAASRCEISANGTDLTALEHAGRGLCETTKPRSPGNSGVVTKHVVNDVVLTTMQRNTRLIQCDICNVTCTNEDILKTHNQGEKHLKNLQKPAVSSTITQEIPPPVSNFTSDGESENKKHNLLQNGASVNQFNIQDTFIKHLEGKKHVVQEIPSNCGTQEARDNVNVGQSMWCEVCKVSCADKIFSTHISGKKHQKNLKNSEKILATPSTPVASMATTPITKHPEDTKSTEGEMVISKFCKIDNGSSVLSTHMKNLKESEKIPGLPSIPIASMTAPPIPAHVEHPMSTEGEIVISKFCNVNCSSNVLNRHMKSLEESEKIPGLPSTPIASVTTPPIFEPVELPKSSEGEIVISKGGELAYCKLCKASCSSNVLSRHLLGKRHQKNLAKSKKIPDSPSTNIASVATPPSTEPVENIKMINGKIVNSDEGKISYCSNVLQKLEKIPVLPSTHIASVATPPSTEPVENLKATKGKIVNIGEGKVGYCSNFLQKSEKIPVSPSTPIISVTTPPTWPVENPNPTKGEIVISNKGKSAWCNLCSVDCGTFEAMNMHVSGKKHQKKVKISEKLQLVGPSTALEAEPAITEPLQDSLNEEGKVVISESSKRKSMSHEEVNTRRQKVMNGEASGALITCTLCNEVCNSPMMFTSHLDSEKHTAMALKQVKAGSNGQKV